MKPYKSKCPKCGSKDLHGIFIKGGTRTFMDFDSRIKFEPDKYVEKSGDYKVVLIGYIRLRCMFCQYTWKVNTLK